MSLVSYTDLLYLASTGVIDEKPEHINGASIDITIGDRILVEDINTSGSVVDLKEKESLNMKEVAIPEQGYLLFPGEFILATSQEVFNLPDNIAAEYKLKSSLARSGLQHLMAGWCDPGWNNSKLTLELTNVTQYHSLLIKPGMKIGQMVFFACEPVPSDQSYAVKGQYNSQETVTANKGVR
jgi:dCTP deaminase